MRVIIIFSNGFRKNFTIIFFLLFGLINLHSQTISPTLTIDLSKPGHAISPALYNSILFEEVNHGVDGGFYAQLIKNGSFEDNNNMDGWSLIDPGSSEGTLHIQSSAETTQLNSNQAHCLKLKITSVDFGSVGAANEGYWGIRLDNKTTYRVSFFARKDPDFKGTITVKFESNDKAFSGYRGFVYASSDPLTPTENWQKFTCELTPAGITHITGENRFVIYGSSTGSLYFDDIRVMPPSFKERPNGLRTDLAEKLSELHPKFIRFPGGSDVGKSKTLDYSWNWKKTIGPLEQRPGMKAQQWNYRNSQQFGLDEIFQMCEDLGADPVYCIPIGNISSVATIDELQPFIQDVLDLIEYSNGDSQTTKWGKQRSANGHSMPYNLKYIEVGNERFYSRGYHERYSVFYSAIKKAYPEIKIIITDLIEDQEA
jgi:alpha-N-arabinofuranosidase